MERVHANKKAKQTDKVSIAQLFELAQKREGMGDAEGAAQLYKGWLFVQPNAPSSHLVWYEFGRVLNKLGELGRSASAFEASFEQKNDFTEAAIALGYAYEAASNPLRAIQIWRLCLSAGGNKTVLLNNIGRVCDSIYQYEQAESALKLSWELNPEQPEVVSTLLHLRQRLCQWPVVSPDFYLAEGDIAKNFGPIASLAAFNDPVKNLESAMSFLCSKGYDKVAPFSMGLVKKLPKLVKNRSDSQKIIHKVRIGFLSADYRMHATSIFFSELLEKLDRSAFEIYALDITISKEVFGGVRDRLLDKVDHHIPLQLINDDEAIMQIRSLGLDIVVDMSGLTAGARPRIVASRVAPIQIAYLGFIASSGMASVDYLITTPDLYREEYASGYSEAPLYLSGPYFAITDDLLKLGNATLNRGECGLPNNAFVYCALVNTYKITQEVFEVWLRILQRVEQSVLWLIDENDTVRLNLRRYASQSGIDPSRLIFAKRLHPSQFRSYLGCADVFLDTSPYGNGATAREAILANLPILTYPGNTMMSRLCGHLMKHIQMDDFVVASWVEYEDFAVRVGQNPDLIINFKGKMALNKAGSALFDVDKYVEQFGEVLLHAYNNQ